MPSDAQFEGNISVTIRETKNGYVVSGYKRTGEIGGSGDMEYVYKTLQEAMSELPGFFSVLGKGKDKPPKNEGELQNLKKKTNKEMESYDEEEGE